MHVLLHCAWRIVCSLLSIYSTDVDRVVFEISEKEALITPSKQEQVRKLVVRLQEKLMQVESHQFAQFKVRVQ